METFIIRRDGKHDHAANLKLKASLALEKQIPLLKKVDYYWTHHTLNGYQG